MRARQLCATVLVIAGVMLLSRVFGQLFFLALGRPAACLAGWWLGVPSSVTHEGVLLLDRTLPIAVTQRCSGADFFALLCGVAAPFVMAPGRPLSADEQKRLLAEPVVREILMPAEP